MSKIKKELTPDEAMKAVNTLLVFMLAEEMCVNLSKTSLYNKSIKMYLNALIKELEKYGNIYEQLCDISHEQFITILNAAETISLPLLNGLQAEHYPIISDVIKVITKKDYALQLAQLKAILVNVK